MILNIIRNIGEHPGQLYHQNNTQFFGNITKMYNTQEDDADKENLLKGTINLKLCDYIIT